MRINCIDVELLSDQHLVAEYREIKMLPKALYRSIHSKSGVAWDELPTTYTLNKGHGKFFYNKLGYINKRFAELLTEMNRRGFATNFRVLIDDVQILYFLCNINFIWNDWSPTKEEQDINIQRILEKHTIRPNFYSFFSIKESYEFWEEYMMSNTGLK